MTSLQERFDNNQKLFNEFPESDIKVIQVKKIAPAYYAEYINAKNNLASQTMGGNDEAYRAAVETLIGAYIVLEMSGFTYYGYYKKQNRKALEMHQELLSKCIGRLQEGPKLIEQFRAKIKELEEGMEQSEKNKKRIENNIMEIEKEMELVKEKRQLAKNGEGIKWHIPGMS